MSLAPTSPLSFSACVLLRKWLPYLPTRLPPLLALMASIPFPPEAHVTPLSHLPVLPMTSVSQGNLGGMKLRRAIFFN